MAENIKVKSEFCERCGEQTPITKHDFKDEFGEEQSMWLCWDCDFDIINGRGDYYDDNVAAIHAEEDYEADPVYYPKPPWLP